MPIPQPFFPSYNRTPKHHGYLNTLHPNPRDEFRTCWGRVEEFLVAGEQEIVHTKPFFFPFSSAATCTNHPLEVDQSLFSILEQPCVKRRKVWSAIQSIVLARSEPGTDPVNATDR
ncbi:hypothetical protein Taro_011515 [Colocasia esculenta]|uniref:Uncharacterized protein n=1 Tax=Colocasia esculenta TaxID=4460 RepID=A0A843UA52_COLES|nr:hypothetical protein [Colocasia esculenta]